MTKTKNKVLSIHSSNNSIHLRSHNLKSTTKTTTATATTTTTTVTPKRKQLQKQQQTQLQPVLADFLFPLVKLSVAPCHKPNIRLEVS